MYAEKIHTWIFHTYREKILDDSKNKNAKVGHSLSPLYSCALNTNRLFVAAMATEFS